MDEQKRDDFKMKVKLAGGKIEEGSDGEILDDEEIAKITADPLYKFPFDEPFMTEAETEIGMRESDQLRKRLIDAGKTPSQDVVDMMWTTERVEAALRGSNVERRAAVNDVLWMKFVQWKRAHNGVCSVDRLKWFVQVDQIRSILYPKPSIPHQAKMIKERFQYEDENGIPRSKISPLHPPPQWYLDYLKKEGHLENYMAQVNEVVNRQVID